MNKTLLCIALFTLSSLQAAEQAAQKPIGYENFPPEIRFEIFKNFIKPALTFDELNARVKNFASWDALNFRLIKNKNEPKHQLFAKAIKEKKEKIKKEALKQAQEMFDELSKITNVRYNFDWSVNGPNALAPSGKTPALSYAFSYAISPTVTPRTVELKKDAQPNNSEEEEVKKILSLLKNMVEAKPSERDILEAFHFKWFFQLCKLLLIAGADPNIIDNKSKSTPLESVVYLSHPDTSQKIDRIKKLIQLLVDYGADVNASTDKYRAGKYSILDVAIQNKQQHLVILEYLYSLGARPLHYDWKPGKALPNN
jgi:hypothetical protein